MHDSGHILIPIPIPAFLNFLIPIPAKILWFHSDSDPSQHSLILMNIPTQSDILDSDSDSSQKQSDSEIDSDSDSESESCITDIHPAPCLLWKKKITPKFAFIHPTLFVCCLFMNNQKKSF